ncbi:MAG: hypothetical protein OXQ29_09535 [Rhodospirillaceae bacterium]|nr:hypothetical protein [Rhodospirillaceae bacterium]
MKHLAQLGDPSTRTCNEKLTTIFPPTDPTSRQLLRNLGALMFAAVTRALEPPDAKPTAALRDHRVRTLGPGFRPRAFPRRPRSTPRRYT